MDLGTVQRVDDLTECERYEKAWGHKPSWDDEEGFEQRVKLIEEHGYNEGMKIWRELNA